MLGRLLCACGTLLLLYSFTYDAAPAGTYNLGLLQEQMMLFGLSCVLLLGGIFLLAVERGLRRMEAAGILPPADYKAAELEIDSTKP